MMLVFFFIHFSLKSHSMTAWIAQAIQDLEVPSTDGNKKSINKGGDAVHKPRWGC